MSRRPGTLSTPSDLTHSLRQRTNTVSDSFLADRNDGRAYASVASVVCTECIVAKRCVLEQKLLLTA